MKKMFYIHILVTSFQILGDLDKYTLSNKNIATIKAGFVAVVVEALASVWEAGFKCLLFSH